MPEAWRIIKARHAAMAFSGEGAALFGGRWNSPDVRIVYVSATKALAALENLVHLNPPMAFKYVAFHLEFDASLVREINPANLRKNWAVHPPPPATQKIGDEWVHSASSAILQVPSVIISGEWNYLLNPAHPDFKKIRIGKPEPFTFDRRLM